MQALSVFATDIDGDGDLDVVISSAVDNQVVWYRNTGSGSFSADPATTPGATYGMSVRVFYMRAFT